MNILKHKTFHNKLQNDDDCKNVTLQRVISRILIAKPCAYQNLTRTANNVCAINNIRFLCITFDVYFYFLINYEYRPKNKHFYLHQVWSI